MTETTVKSTGKRSFRTVFLAYANIIFWTGAAFFGGRALLGTLGNGSGVSDSVKLLITFGFLLFCALFVWLGVFILKSSPTIFYYEDGFTIGKNGEKILYDGLQYHFGAGRVPDKFSIIFYKSEGKLKRINALSYASNAFQTLQEDVVNTNLPQAIRKIENGESVIFRAKKPNALGMTSLKNLAQKFDDGVKVAINKNSISFDDEVYKWSDYTVISDYVGLIVVLDPATNRKILTFSQNYMIEQPNVVTALINTFGGR